MTDRATPFANGFEVDWFRSARCDRCRFDHPDGGGCDDFALGLLDDGWPAPLTPVAHTAANPLGVECQRYQSTDTPAPSTGDTQRSPHG